MDSKPFVIITYCAQEYVRCIWNYGVLSREKNNTYFYFTQKNNIGHFPITVLTRCFKLQLVLTSRAFTHCTSFDEWSFSRTRTDIFPFWVSGVGIYFACVSLQDCLQGLTFMWWGHCSLCLWHKLTKLALSFLFCSCVCFCLYEPYNCISFHKFSRQLCLFSLCSPGLIFLPYWSFQLYISLWKSPSALI